MEPQPSTQPQQASRKSNIWKWIIGIVIGLFILSRIGANSNTQPSSESLASTPSVDTTATTSGEATTTQNSTNTQQNWSYYEDEDKMGSKVKIASVTSPELLQFDFPYQGGSEATLSLRRKGGSLDIYLRVSKGQFISSAVDGGTCRIRFDSKPALTYSYSGAADYSSDIIFLNNEKSLLKKIKSADKMIIEVAFYNEGNRQIEFDVSNLKFD